MTGCHSACSRAVPYRGSLSRPVHSTATEHQAVREAAQPSPPDRTAHKAYAMPASRPCKKSEVEATEEKSMYSQLRPCVWILAALGIWPIQEKRGRIVFRKLSLPFAFAVLTCAGNAYVGWRTILHWVRVVARVKFFSVKVYFAFFVLIAHVSLVFPLLYWPSLRDVARAFNCTHRFQDSYRRSLGAPVHLRLWRRALVALWRPAVGFSLAVWTHFAGHTPWNQVPHFEVIAVYLMSVAAIWALVTAGLGNAACQLRHHLGQVLEGGGQDQDVERLRAVRGLWLQLEAAMALWGRAWVAALTHFCLHTVVSVLLTAFGNAIPLLRGLPHNDRQLGLGVSTILNTYNLYTVCTAGYRLRQQVKGVFTKDLARVKFPAHRTIMYEEVIKFLKAIELQDPHISLGYAVLDRTYIVHGWFLQATYMMVLLQFAYAKGAQ